jgi:hypothetical protein
MPDVVDPPTATGEALKTVKAHQKPHDLVFHAVRPRFAPISLGGSMLTLRGHTGMVLRTSHHLSVLSRPSLTFPHLHHLSTSTRSYPTSTTRSRSYSGFGSRWRRRDWSMSTRKSTPTPRYASFPFLFPFSSFDPPLPFYTAFPRTLRPRSILSTTMGTKSRC